MKVVQSLALAFGLLTVGHAHMEMKWPPPLKSKFNPNAGYDVDYSMTAPLSASGSDFPCKGYQKVLGTPAGKPVVEWEAGQSYNMTITGAAIHNGGSCQASLSTDKGKTWTVIHSYIGNCPIMGDSDWKFTLPSDTPTGDTLFAWSWFNKVGNREMYMNCASVSITGGAGKRAASDSFTSRPAMFVANVGNGCATVESKDVMFPDPGPDVDDKSQGTSPPTGNCGKAGAGAGSGSGSGSPPVASSAPAGSAPSIASSAPMSSAPPVATTTVNPVTTSVASSIPGGVFLTAPPVPSVSSIAAPATSAAPTFAQNSTMLTVTKSASVPLSTMIPTAQPAPTSSASPSSGSGSGTPTQGAFSQGMTCASEGDWNCVGGTQFQRCASGQWSALLAMAQGTSCSPGQSDTLVMLRKRGGSRIHYMA